MRFTTTFAALPQNSVPLAIETLVLLTMLGLSLSEYHVLLSRRRVHAGPSKSSCGLSADGFLLYCTVLCCIVLYFRFIQN